jgi:NodT family efflux transporter outer membrane factor (OMF) lipoprotein
MRHGALAARWLAVGLSASLLSCASAPKSEPVRAAFAADNTGLTGPALQPVPERWWQSFGDAQLDRLIEQALSDNLDLAQAGARVRMAQAQAENARAGQLPALKLDAGETRLKIPSGFPPALDAGHTVWSGDLGAVLSWDLDLWGEHADATAQARALVRATSLDAQNSRRLICGAIAQAYIDLYRNDELADIAQRAEAQRANILAITRQRLAAGLDTRVELREAEGGVPQARVATMQAQSAADLAVHQLAALAGHGAEAYAAIGRPMLNLEAALPLPAQLPIDLLARRPDVMAARARIEAADAQRRAAKAAFYPKVNLLALAGFASFSLSDLIGASAFGYGAGPSLSLPLFDGGRLRAQYSGAEATLDTAVAAYNDTVVGAVHQVADQLSLIDALRGEIEQQHEALVAADDAYALAEKRYRAGLASYLSVLTAETQVLSERQQQVELGSSLALARISLLLAVGGSFEPAPQTL